MPHNRKTAQPHVFLPPERSTACLTYIIYNIYVAAHLTCVTATYKKDNIIQQMFNL